MYNTLGLHTEASLNPSSFHQGNVISAFLGIITPVILPCIHFAVYNHLWGDKYNYVVNKNNCTCSCWDTIFKGKTGLLVLL